MTYTEGILGDGAAILKDGVMVPIEEVVSSLNDMERYRKALLAWKWMMANDNYDMGELISEFDRIVSNSFINP